MEVILSAGTINSPKLLMLSGIGDSNELQSIGIDTIVDLPDVGKNVQDHALLTNVWSVNSTDTFDPILRNQTMLAEVLQQWTESHTGPASSPGGNQVGWIRLPKNASIFETVQDPSAGPTSGHYEMIISVSVPSVHSHLYLTSLMSSVGRLSVFLASESVIRELYDHHHERRLHYLS